MSDELSAATPTDGSAAATQRHSLARNASVMLASQAIGWVLALFGTTIQPRFLGPEAIGRLRLANSMWAIGAVLFAFGTSSVVTVELARDQRRAGLIGRAIGIQSVLFVLVWAGVLAFSIAAGYDGSVLLLVLIIGLWTSFSCISGPAHASFLGLEQLTTPAIIDVATKIITALVVLAVLVAGFGVNVVAATGAIGGIGSTIFIVRALRRRVGSDALRPTLRGAKPLLRQGWPFLLNDATLVIYLQVDTVIISLLASDEEIGWYSAADTLFGALLFVPTIVTTSMFPVLARLDEQNVAERDRLVRRSFSFLMVMAVPMGLGTFAVARPVARLLYGSDFTPSGAVLAVYGLVLLLSFPTILLGKVALATGRQRFWAHLMIVATAASIPVDLVLVPWTHRRFDNGALGGALAYLVTETIILVPALRWVAPQLASRRVVFRLAKVLLAGAALVAVAWPLRNEFLLLPIAAGATVYLALVAIMRVLDAEELDMMKRMWSRVSGGALARRRG